MRLFSCTRRVWRVVPLVWAVVCTFLIGWRLTGDSYAAMQNYLVIVGQTKPSAATNVLFSFKPNTTTTGGMQVRLSFHPSFTLPVAAATSDVVFTIDSVTQTVGLIQTTTTHGLARSGNAYVFTVASGTTIGAASSVRMIVGRDGTLTNPPSVGTYGVGTQITTMGGSTVNSHASNIAIVDAVAFSAFVSSTSPSYVIRWATPELRVGATETNDDARFFVTARTSIDTDNVIQYTDAQLATTSNDGTYYTTTTMTGLSSGTYDVGIKTHQHLTKLIQDVTLTAGTTTVLNFTNETNTSTKGSERLLAGDISGLGNSTTTLGDDVINAVDISILVNDLDDDDLTGNVLRPNLNQDVVVNAVDLSILIKNLDLEGER